MGVVIPIGLPAGRPAGDEVAGLVGAAPAAGDVDAPCGNDGAWGCWLERRLRRAMKSPAYGTAPDQSGFGRFRRFVFAALLME